MSKPEPEALRLADELELNLPRGVLTDSQAAAKLRRLHDFEEQHRAIDECWIAEIAAVREQRDGLLKALHACLEKGGRWHPCDPVVVAARAAIAKATGVKA